MPPPVIGGLGGLGFGLLVLFTEWIAQLVLGTDPLAGHRGLAPFVFSYLVPSIVAGLVVGLALGARKADASFERVLAALSLSLAVLWVAAELAQRLAISDRLGPTLPFVTLVGWSTALSLWIAPLRCRTPLPRTWPEWVRGGVWSGVALATVVSFQAHTNVFLSPFAASSLVGTVLIGLASLVAGMLLARAFVGACASTLGRGAMALLAIVALLVLPRVGGEPGAIETDKTTRQRGVLLIVADTLRADALGSYRPRKGGASDTPRLDGLAERGVRFDSCVSAAPWTLPSFASLLTSRFPSGHGAAQNPGDGNRFTPLAEGVPTLAESLREAGVRTAALVNNTYLQPAFRVDRGFDSYRMLRDSPDSQILYAIRRVLGATAHCPYARADAVTDAVVESVERYDGGPFFLMAQYMDAHAPYYDHETGAVYPDQNIDDVMPEARAAYRSEVRFLDREIGRLLDRLEQRGLLDSLLVVFTGDHGEEFHDHGGTGHGWTLYDEQLRVPLVVLGSGAAVARVDEDPVGLVDVMPTLLEWFGASPPDGVAGASFLSRIRADSNDGASRSYVAESCYGPERKMIRFEGWKMIEHHGGESAGRVELYDLEADPGEKRDLADREQERVEQLRARLEDSRLEGALPSGGSVELDEKARDRLRRLGYVLPDEATRDGGTTSPDRQE